MAGLFYAGAIIGIPLQDDIGAGGHCPLCIGVLLNTDSQVSSPHYSLPQKKKPDLIEAGLFRYGCLTMSYFHTGSPYYHRR